MKQCTKCKKILDNSFYTKDIQKKNGLRSSCKACNIKAKPKEVLSQEYKRCSKCKKALLKTFFNRNKRKPDGFYSSCKDCRATFYGIDPNKRFKPKGTKIITREGYIRIAGTNNRQHRIIMENILGRKLKRNEHVHHINGIKTDNRPENLEVISASDHARHHYLEIKEKLLFREIIQKNCLVCNKEYSTKAYTSKYCSAKCMRTTRKEYYKQWVAKNRSRN